MQFIVFMLLSAELILALLNALKSFSAKGPKPWLHIEDYVPTPSRVQIL